MSKLESFTLSFESGGNANEGTVQGYILYANGKHQCPVSVQITKVSDDGRTQETLTAEELETLQIVAYSDDLNLNALPYLWYQTRVRDYTYALAPTLSRSAEPAVAEDRAGSTRFIPYRYTFYLSTFASEPAHLMARIVLQNGTIYATTMDTSYKKFSSSLIVCATMPYVVRPIDLHGPSITQCTISWNANHTNYRSGSTYFWSLPDGLRVTAQGYEGNYLFQLNEGAEWKKNSAQIATLGQTQALSSGCQSNGKDYYYPITVPDTGFTVAFQHETNCYFTYSYYTSRQISVVDNYGCFHIFVFYPSDKYGTGVSVCETKSSRLELAPDVLGPNGSTVSDVDPAARPSPPTDTPSERTNDAGCGCQPPS